MTVSEGERGRETSGVVEGLIFPDSEQKAASLHHSCWLCRPFTRSAVRVGGHRTPCITRLGEFKDIGFTQIGLKSIFFILSGQQILPLPFPDIPNPWIYFRETRSCALRCKSDANRAGGNYRLLFSDCCVSSPQDSPSGVWICSGPPTTSPSARATQQS